MKLADRGESPFARHWGLDPEIDFLNHGSFGACPTPVLEAQQEFRNRLEREPVRFMIRELPDLLDGARQELAAFVGSDPEELAFVPNATAGINAVLRSLPIEEGDELLTTDHEYNACRNVLDEVARVRRASVVVAPVPFPLASSSRVEQAILERVGPRTRLLLLDHVTSPTGLVLAAENAARALAEKGVDVVIDGAHAPGMVPLDLRAMPEAFYTGNCHKWMCTPKGAAFVRVPLSRQREIRPPIISHGANAPVTTRSRFRLEFDWMGTHDPTPALCIGEAIRFLGSLVPGGWTEIRRRNRDLALEGRRILTGALGVADPAPEEMIGSLAAVPLPDSGSEAAISPFGTDPLQDRLLQDFQIEVPVMPWPGPPHRLLRISAQIYNHRPQYERLAVALRELLALG